jgi:phosphatidate cytidylyltransferase
MFSQIRIGIEATFYGVILTSFPVKILQLQNGDIYFLILLITVFSADTFAYFSGKLFGKKKLYPSISPNKTMAGLYGALIGSTLTGGTCFILLSKASPFFAFSTAMVVGFVSLNGDLFASLLKRSVDKKDSGKIMPGHGGLIDRLDGVIFASPIFYSIIRLMLENKILR